MDDERKGSTSASVPKCRSRYSWSKVSDSYNIPRESTEALGAALGAAVAAVSAAALEAAAVAALEAAAVAALEAVAAAAELDASRKPADWWKCSRKWKRALGLGLGIGLVLGLGLGLGLGLWLWWGWE